MSKILKLKVLLPTPEQAENGLRQLRTCLPYWTKMAGLLLIKPRLALIVSVTDAETNKTGFTLRLRADDRLIAPAQWDASEMTVGCDWNQPYMSFDKDLISAPYSFRLHFTSEDLASVRERMKSFKEKYGSRPLEQVIGLLSIWFEGKEHMLG
jgi:hypothetical protein